MKNITKIDKKILIIGANGFLGKNILQLRNNEDINYSILAADIIKSSIPKEVPFYKIDITNSDETYDQIVKISPEIILLTAAMTDVDQNEVNKELATKINTQGPINVIKACKKTNSKLFFISTDFVFDGISKEGDYNEEDEPRPLSHYALTKYNAEQAIIHSDIDYCICRSAVLYGWNREKLNFITWILSKLEKGEQIKIVSSQINNPTFIKNLAQILLKLVSKGAKGIYHTAGDEPLTRYEMANKCAEIFNYNKELIIPIKYFEQKAIRPKNVGLNINKLKKKICSELKIFNLDDGLKYMYSHREKLKY